jgi:hypothetical protein
VSVVLDSFVEKGRGVVAEVLVRWGRISIGDCVVVGSCYGKVPGPIALPYLISMRILTAYFSTRISCSVSVAIAYPPSSVSQ